MKNRDKRIKSNKSSINDSQKDVFFETFDEIKENENRDNEDTLTVEPYRNKVVSKIIPSRPILVDCFLNNGILITTYFDEDIILKELKMIVLEKAKKMPLFTQLLDVDQYSLKSINIRFNFVTPVDENVTLKSLNLIYPFFEFNAKKPVLATYSKLQLNILMHDVKVDMDTTGNTFENYCFMAKAARSGKLIQDHINSSNYNIVKYLYPPQYTLSTKLAPEIIESLYSEELFCYIYFSRNRSYQRLSSFVILENTLPSDIIKKCFKYMRGLSDFPNLYDKDCSTYMMKTCGKNQYLFDEVPIISYTFVEEMVFEKKEISFLLIHQDEIYKKGYTVASDLTLSAKKLDRINKVISYHKRFDYEIEYDCLLVDQVSYCESSESDCDEYEQNLDTMNIDDNIEDSLDIDTVVEKPFQIEILTVNSNTLSMNNNTLPDHGVFYFQIAMFIGTTRLTEYFNTTKVDSVYLNWRSLYDLNIDYRDVCRDAYISFRLLHMLKKTGKVAKHLFWLNIPVYDEKGCPTMGEISHRMWKFQSKVEDFDCPGTIQECGDTSAPILNVRFKVQKLVDFRIEDNLNKIIDKILSKNKIKPVRIENGVVFCDSETEPSAYFTEMYKWFFVDKLGPPLNSVQKKMFWKDRYYFANHPEVLVQYMQIVKWTDMKCINEFYAFLQLFDHVGLRFALALLDNRFVDTRIRKFAVDSLRKHCKDEEIILYMIQLIQALKAEKYLDNALIFFLLERSWSNARVGHCFYWTLSTECADPYYKNRFNIFLYIYCRYCGEFSHSLVNQVTALRRLNILAVHMKYNSTDLDHVLQRELSNPEIKAAVSNFISPINISHQHGKIIPHLCKVMTSKKKPLWLVWENSDPQSHLYYKEYNLIFKSGDDLRQDMLTLQMFRVLDRIWKDIGVDVKLIPYGCQSIGHDVGVIEVVRGSCTLYAIQKSAVMSAMQINSAGLLKWIKLNHSTADEYRKAIQNFTYSCAGYCVATYILGIRDRHNDNIMLTKSGHVFHIDFGHFLNHKKKKLGIIRERVPFILTNDFLNVITNGKDNPLETNEFKIFTKICHKIYAALFDSHQFFINIFLMMIPSGIEELSVKDIEYLRQILCVSLSLKDARNYFDADMLVSINMSWTTKVDWFWHWTAHK